LKIKAKGGNSSSAQRTSRARNLKEIHSLFKKQPKKSLGHVRICDSERMAAILRSKRPLNEKRRVIDMSES
jgi:hypothetical protein